MSFKNFEELINAAKAKPGKLRCAVVGANEESLLDSIMDVTKDGIAAPILIGDAKFINDYYASIGYDCSDVGIIDEPDYKKAADIAVGLVQTGDCQCIMKGEIKTADLMKTILRAENGLRTGRVLSAFSIRELPNYHKLLGFADTGICIYPSIDEKVQIIENSVGVLQSLGVEIPKVAAVCGVENVNPKMPETVDAAELKKMNEEGVITDCIVEGPISYDLAVSKRSGEIKGFTGPVVGDADLILFPNLVSGNLTTKALEYHADVKGAAIIVGAKIPIIFGSRAATREFRYRSIALACVCSDIL